MNGAEVGGQVLSVARATLNRMRHDGPDRGSGYGSEGRQTGQKYPYGSDKGRYGQGQYSSGGRGYDSGGGGGGSYGRDADRTGGGGGYGGSKYDVQGGGGGRPEGASKDAFGGFRVWV